MKKVIATFLILFSIAMHAQDVLLSPKQLTSQYKIKLDLTRKQTSDFIFILEQFNTKLYKKGIGNKDFNKLNKLRDLEFYKMLNSEQFDKYKKVKLEIEPTLKFRFN